MSPTAPANPPPQPETRPPSPWRMRLLYGGFTGFCFLIFLLLSFPYETLGERLTADAGRQGLQLRMAHVGGGFFSAHATGVEVSRKSADEAKPAEPLRLDSLTIRPSFFPLGIGFSASLLSGHASGAIGGLKEGRLKVSFSDLNLASPGFQAVTGVQTAGKVQGEADLRMPTPNASSAPDFSKLQGSFTLKGEGLTVLGGTVVVPLYGTLTPVDLPRASLGEVDAAVQFENGTATLQKLNATGGDLQVNGSGSMQLDRQLPLSQLNLALKLKAEPEFQKRLGLLGSGLTLLPEDPKQPGWRTARVSGLLDRLQFGPGR